MVETRATQATGAVVVDRWPLMRIGMRRAVQEAGLSVAGEATDVQEALEQRHRSGAGVVVVGDPDEGAMGALRRASSAAIVVALVGQATRQQLLELLGAGVSGVGLRSAALGEVADLLRRALQGERALAPALVSVLVDRRIPVTVAAPATGTGAADPGGLTSKERRVLAALASGSSNSEIAAELFVSPATVKTHLAHIYAKLQVGGRNEALSRAVALGLVH